MIPTKIDFQYFVNTIYLLRF